MTRPPLALRFLPVAVMGAAHLIALFIAELDIAGAQVMAGATKAWLMPALLVSSLWAIPTVRSRIALWGTLAIVFSWFGDVLLASPGDSGFLIGLGSFFLAHVAYLVLILRHLALKRRRWLVASPAAAVAVVWWGGFVLLLAPYAGSLLIPIALYGLVLAAMATAAWLANRLVAIGAMFFLASDSILGLSMFVPNFDFWQIDVVIMLTYLLGQTLIAGGAVRHCLAGITWAKAPLPPE
jgi:uncharacterized membrane protein YhhN